MSETFHTHWKHEMPQIPVPACRLHPLQDLPYRLWPPTPLCPNPLPPAPAKTGPRTYTRRTPLPGQAAPDTAASCLLHCSLSFRPGPCVCKKPFIYKNNDFLIFGHDFQKVFSKIANFVRCDSLAAQKLCEKKKTVRAAALTVWLTLFFIRMPYLPLPPDEQRNANAPCNPAAKRPPGRFLLRPSRTIHVL